MEITYSRNDNYFILDIVLRETEHKPIYVERCGITEQLKAAYQMEWVGRMNNITTAIEEIILSEIVYA